MKKKKRSRSSKAEPISVSFYEFFKYVLDLCVCVYIFLILVVMPFYNEEGFNHIGTDKSTFFKNCTIYGSKIVLPLLAIMAVTGVIMHIRTKGIPNGKALSVKSIIAACKKQFSSTDCFALAYGISVIIAYLCSDYKETAMWGVKGWYMGLIPQLTVVVVYFLISRAWTRRNWLVALILPVSFIVFALGYLNRFGIYPIDMKLEAPEFISTIGNINWYCGYLVSIFFGVMFLFWKVEWKKVWQQLLMMGYLVIGFATLVTQGSSSGIFTMAVLFLFLFWLSVSDSRSMESFWLEMVLFSATCLVTCIMRVCGLLEITYIDTLIDLFTYSLIPIIMTLLSLAFWAWVRVTNNKGRYPQKIWKGLSVLVCGGSIALVVLFVILLAINTAGGGIITKMTTMSEQNVLTFSPTWGSNRGATWTCGWLCFWEQDVLHKLTGVGPDCMEAFLYGAGSAELVAVAEERFGTARLTNAHNEWLTILVNMGLLGLVSYAGMMITAIKRYIQSRNVKVITAACGICVLAYTVNNMFSFQQSMNIATIAVILGIGENYMREE
ncbi:MAG: O-antigen ligase family protein [Lachnospiraceae bacterium]|nr:O-antigen ligase family protein [Lachnospiraceae bacterium]